MSPYPLETVASIAARLLSGDDYETAAKRAICILAACEAELAKATPAGKAQALHDQRAASFEKAKAAPTLSAEALAEITEQNDRPDWLELMEKDTAHVRFAAALKGITGKRTDSIAKEAFRKFLALEDDQGSRKAGKQFAELESRGFTGKDVRVFRARYLAQFPREKPKPRQLGPAR